MRGTFEKVQRFFRVLERLEQSERRLSDIYYCMEHFDKFQACEYLDENDRICGMTFHETHSKTSEYAYNIDKLLTGFPKDKVVAIKLPNSPQWGMIFFAILMAGYRPLLLDAKAEPAIANDVLGKCAAVAIITDDDSPYAIKKISLHEVMHKGRKGFKPQWADHVILYTSGTTQTSKILVFDGKALSNQVISAKSMYLTTNDIMFPDSVGRLRILALLPFHHVFGFVAVFLWYSFFGRTIVYLNDMLPATILSTCRRLKITHVYAVPLFWNLITRNVLKSAKETGRTALFQKMMQYNLQEISKKDAGLGASKIVRNKVHAKLLGPHVKYCISGGGKLSEETLRTINGIGYPLYNGYGMTEIGVTSVELRPSVRMRIASSIGRPLFGVEYKIDPFTPDSHDGELLVKTGTLHSFEIKDGKPVTPELVDGFYRTGDIASIDERGYAYIHGRIKDIIINADGENIYPDEIEERFIKLPYVNRFCVVGLEDKLRNREKITLIFDADTSFGEREEAELVSAFDEINANLVLAKRIEEVYYSKADLPVVNTIKIQKNALKQSLLANPANFRQININRGFVKFDDLAEAASHITERVTKLFAEILSLPVNEITPEGNFSADYGGDSYSYAELIVSIHDEFNLVLPVSLYGKLATVRDFTRFIMDQQSTNP